MPGPPHSLTCDAIDHHWLNWGYIELSPYIRGVAKVGGTVGTFHRNSNFRASVPDVDSGPLLFETLMNMAVALKSPHDAFIQVNPIVFGVAVGVTLLPLQVKPSQSKEQLASIRLSLLAKLKRPLLIGGANILLCKRATILGRSV